jgi:hypothetical protein
LAANLYLAVHNRDFDPGWQWATVTANYGGNWTALFCTGAVQQHPPLAASERVYLFANSTGYDGQFYHYVAHDPMMRSDLKSYIDDPGLRYRRILIPLLAYGIATGRSQWVDWYIREPSDPPHIAAMLFASAGTVFERTDQWQNVYAFGRIHTPLLICLAAIAGRCRRPWLLAPVAMILPRLLIQLSPQILGVVSSIVQPDSRLL